MRFRLETLLLSTLVLATSMATFGAVAGIVAALFGLGLVALNYHPRTRARPWEWVVVAAGIGLLGMCLIPAVKWARDAAQGSQCQGHLKQLVLGLHNYHDWHKSLPPATMGDAGGKPMHSWRVLVLPYIEQLSLYGRYRFDEPWDGPGNRRLAGAMPWYAYRCPSDDATAAIATSYAAVVGTETAWPGAKSMKFDEFGDGMENTILLVEVADSGIHWMEPRDLTLEEALRGIQRKGGQGWATPHPDGSGVRVREIGALHVVMADGSLRSLPRDLSPKTLRALCTANGGEKIDWESPEFTLERPIPFWWAPGAAMIGSYALLIWRLRAAKRRTALPPGEGVSPASHDGPRTTDQEPLPENR